MENQYQLPHRRLNPLNGEWILVSPHRLDRPWQGKTEEVAAPSTVSHDPKCYLCPGNTRNTGSQNPDYTTTYIFDNDFPAILPEGPASEQNECNGLIQQHSETGICRVICFSPAHNVTLAEMPVDDIADVITAWQDLTREMLSNSNIAYVQIFENKGAIMGCSNPHPHGQMWATQSIPYEPERESVSQKQYFDSHKRTLLQDYVGFELQTGDRIVYQNATWLAVVPFWAKWPFELLVLPKQPVVHLTDLSESQYADCADILKQVTLRYDNLFETSFPYTMGLHQAPVDGGEYPYWHLHFHFYPPLLRSATVQKFMVGFEMLGNPQRDLTPETAAERLAGLDSTHFRHR